MASPLLRFIFLLACVLNFAKGSGEASTLQQKIEEKTNVQPAATPQAEATNNEDLEAILRELQTQDEPAPEMATGMTASIKGSFTFNMNGTSASEFIANSTLKKALEDELAKKIAEEANVAASQVFVIASVGRRLESNEPRQLAGTIKIDYTITTTNAKSATVLASVQAAMTVEKITKATQDAIRAIDPALCAACANITVLGTVITAAPAVEVATTTSATDTSSADRSHVLWAIFSFAATWVL